VRSVTFITATGVAVYKQRWRRNLELPTRTVSPRLRAETRGNNRNEFAGSVGDNSRFDECGWYNYTVNAAIKLTYVVFTNINNRNKASDCRIQENVTLTTQIFNAVEAIHGANFRRESLCRHNITYCLGTLFGYPVLLILFFV
jgi:hypothetical protein